MIKTLTGNLFTTLDTISMGNVGDMHIIIHGCNAQGRMGSGFAKELRDRFPGAYEAYATEYNKEHHLKMGSNVIYQVNDELLISNSITQEFYGYDGNKYVSYDAIDAVFYDLNNFAKELKEDGLIEEVHFHFPKIGSDLGGGNWDVIKHIIDSRVQDATKTLYVL